MNMKLLYCPGYVSFFLFTSILLASVQAGTEVLRPRGVPLSKKSFYDPGKDFQCLDGSTTIPFLLVNDDYCDCDDGSDEPGTNACPNGLFHCSNIGYIEKIIPSSRVNDGICDCCDGSDEYNSSIKCQNNCLALGEQMRVERERYLELLKQGNEIRQKYIEESKTRIEETKKELNGLKSDMAEAEALKNEKMQAKTQAEELEKEALDKHRAEEERLRKINEEEVQKQKELEDSNFAKSIFKKLDTNQDDILTYLEMKTFTKFDRDNDGIVSDDEAKFYLNAAAEMNFEEFLESAWPIVKPIFENEKTISEPTNDNANEVFDNSNDKVPPPYETEEEYQTNAEELEEEEAEHPHATPLPESTTQISLEYDEPTAKLVEEAKKTREEFSEAEGKFLDIQTKIRELEVLLESDHGPNGEYMALRGHCFELHENEYIYKLCPFDSASQRPKHGGTETSLGRWGKWVGPENNRYERFIMEGGVQCWNGPARHVIVYVSCGTENQLIKASEPNRCEYAFEFKTPAACMLSGSVPQADEHHEHIEL